MASNVDSHSLPDKSGTIRLGIPSKYRPSVRNGVAAATALGVPSAFSLGLDAAAVAAVWAAMLKSMSTASSRELDSVYVAKLVGTVLAGCGSYLVAIRIGTALFNVIPGAGTTASIAINSGLNAILTFRLGSTFATMLEQPDFELTDMAKITKTFLRAFISIPTAGERGDFSNIIQGI